MIAPLVPLNERPARRAALPARSLPELERLPEPVIDLAACFAWVRRRCAFAAGFGLAFLAAHGRSTAGTGTEEGVALDVGTIESESCSIFVHLSFVEFNRFAFERLFNVDERNDIASASWREGVLIIDIG